jgi:hypothetical protein
MSEKKTVGDFLRKTFALKKTEDEIAAEKTQSKSTARPATKTSAKSATKTATKATPKTTPKTAVKSAAAKTPAKAAAKTATKSATASTPTKPAAKTLAKPASTKTVQKTPTRSSSQPTAAQKKMATPVSSTKEKTSAESIKEKKPIELSKTMTKADNVRLYIYQNYLKPSKLKGQNKITLVAGDVHTEMGLKSEMPTVCSAMKTRIDRLYDVEILDIKPQSGNNSKLTIKYDLKNLYMEEEAVKRIVEKAGTKKPAAGTKTASVQTADSESSYLILKELEEKLRQFVSARVEKRFGKEWWKGTDMSFLAERWNERRIMNDRTNADKKRNRDEPLINYASFSDYRRIINNPFAWDAFEEYFPDRGWIIQRLKELDPIRNAIMHHTPLESDDYTRLGLYSRDILKIIDAAGNK